MWICNTTTDNERVLLQHLARREDSKRHWAEQDEQDVVRVFGQQVDYLSSAFLWELQDEMQLDEPYWN